MLVSLEFSESYERKIQQEMLVHERYWNHSRQQCTLKSHFLLVDFILFYPNFGLRELVFPWYLLRTQIVVIFAYSAAIFLLS